MERLGKRREESDAEAGEVDIEPSVSRGAMAVAPSEIMSVGMLGDTFHPTAMQPMQDEVTYRSMPQTTSFASATLVSPPPLTMLQASAPKLHIHQAATTTAPGQQKAPPQAPQSAERTRSGSLVRDFEASNASVSCSKLPSGPSPLSPCTHVVSPNGCSLVEVGNAVTRALLRRGVDFELDQARGLWRCALSTCCVYVTLLVQLFESSESDDSFVVDVQRRSGEPLAFGWVFRAVRCAVLGLADSEADKAVGNTVVDYHVRSVLPAPQDFEDDYLCEDSCADFLKLCSLSYPSEVRAEGMRALSERIAQEDERILLEEDEAQALLVAQKVAEMLCDTDLITRSFAASAAANLSESSLFQAKLLSADLLGALAIGVDDGSYRDAHLRRECARALRNLVEGNGEAVVRSLGRDVLEEMATKANGMRDPRIRGYVEQATKRLSKPIAVA